MAIECLPVLHDIVKFRAEKYQPIKIEGSDLCESLNEFSVKSSCTNYVYSRRYL